jgi:hypothetical protein
MDYNQRKTGHKVSTLRLLNLANVGSVGRSGKSFTIFNIIRRYRAKALSKTKLIDFRCLFHEANDWAMSGWLYTILLRQWI